MSFRTNRRTGKPFPTRRYLRREGMRITEEKYPDDTIRYDLRSGNDLLGFARIGWCRGCDKDGFDEARIRYIQINPELRKQGLGKAFYRQLERMLRKKGVTTISLRPADDEVYRFWRGLGFVAERPEDVPTYIGAGDLLKRLK